MAICKKKFWGAGEPWVWVTAAGMTLVMLMTVGFFAIIVINGLSALWPSDVVRIVTTSGDVIAGEIIKKEWRNDKLYRLQLKTANRDVSGHDFKWITADTVDETSYPPDIYVIERVEYGNFIGYLAENNPSHIKNYFVTEELHPEIEELSERIDQIHTLVGTYNDQLWAEEKNTPVNQESISRYQYLIEAQNKQVATLEQELDTYRALFITTDGKEKSIRLSDIIRFYQPSSMSIFAKTVHYAKKVGELLFDEPREANMEGGVFPAAFGTVLLVFIMSITSFPFGVLAGIYLGVYAGHGFFLQLVRVAVNNLAGIPSIVFGIFGLGFFIYGLGSGIDELFFAKTLPEPTFGTGGLLWASLSLGLLTMPVVIVAVEEALRAIPSAFRDSSLALGATRLQTLWRVLLPAASPGILTGFILAMARAAGEVAPLMITGVVKLAPSLPIDGTFPLLHLDRKFMHLGFHIYDISCQSPNIEAAKPLVYASTLLLVVIVLLMTGSSVWLRSYLRKKYSVSSGF